MTLRLGKKPATKDPRDLLFADFKAPALQPAPIGFSHVTLLAQPWGMLGNDQVGDCAIAGPAHETMLLNAEAGKEVQFTTEGVIAIYSAITGYDPADPTSDQGSDVRDVLAYRRSEGFADATGAAHKIGAYVALAAGDWVELLEALAVFECVGIGIEVPESAMEQFQAGDPWEPVAGSPIEGGHYVPVVARPEANLVEVVTWGALQEMTQEFSEKYCDEAWAYIIRGGLHRGEDARRLRPRRPHRRR